MSPDAFLETLATLNGPLPTGLVSSEENGNSVSEIFCQRRDGRMPNVVSPMKGAYAFVRVKRTVRSSTVATPTPVQFAYSGLLSHGSWAFFTVKTTSAEVTGEPSANLAFLRRTNVYVLLSSLMV